MSAPTVTTAGDPTSSGIARGASATEDAGLRSPIDFRFEVHPAWAERAPTASRFEEGPPMDAPQRSPSGLRAWLRETILAPGARAPWLDLDRARVSVERLASLVPGPTLLLGMGGSALGARATLAWAAADGDVPHPVRVLDTVDPEVVREHLTWREQTKARVLVVSKSGTTIEVQRLLDALFERGLSAVVFVADPVRTPMDERFTSSGCTVDRFDMPADVGGRYSVLTAVGQVPLRCAGLEPHALLDGASSLRTSWQADAKHSASAVSGALTGDLGELSRAIAFRLANPAAVHVVWCYADRLIPYAAWLQQLDNESLGRHRGPDDHVGEIILPLRGPADQHSVAQLLLDGPRDKRVLFLDRLDATDVSLAGLSSLRAAEARAAFEAVGEVHPTARCWLPGRGLGALGAAFLRGMLEVVALGAAMSLDPYGQPAVEAIKRRIRER